MSFIERLTTWQKILGTVMLIVGMMSGIWAFMNSHFMPRAEAADDHVSIGERWEREAKAAIAVKEDEKIKIKYDSSLVEQAREELIAVRDREIRELNKRIACWDGRQSLECWRD